MTTFDEFFRFVILPALLGIAALALWWNLREMWREWRRDGW